MDSETPYSVANGPQGAGGKREPNFSRNPAASPIPKIIASEAAITDALAPADPKDVQEALRPISARSVKRRSFFNDIPDKGLFVLFAVTGFAAMFAAKSRGMPGLATELVALGVLFAYAVISSLLRWFRLHPDRLGDNCYYMGFLFTLASLSAALIAIQTQTEAAQGALLESLIGSFGVALFSTIGGITLRVFFMQMRREIEDVEETIRNELQDAAQRLKDQLGEAVQSLEGFRLRTTQVMDEQLSAAVSEFVATSKKLAEHIVASGAAHAAASERLARGSEQAASELARAAGSMASNIQESAASHKQATESLVGISKKVTAEVSRLIQRIDRIEVPSDLLTRQLEDTRRRIGGLAATLEAATKSDADRQAATERAAASLDRLSPAVDAANVAIRSVAEQAVSQANTMSALAAQAERDVAAIAQARTAAQADLAQSAAAVHKLQETLAIVAENLVKRLGDG